MKSYNVCFGCGAKLQNEYKESNGYAVDLNNKYCLSCFKLKHYGEYTKKIIDTSEINKIIDSIIDTKEEARIYYLIDLFNLHASVNKDLLNKLKTNGIETIFIINKVDLFRDVSNLEKITEFFVAFIKELGFKEPMFLIMNNTSEKLIDELIEVVLVSNKKQYFVGVSNSGKSTMINSMLKKLYNINQIVESFIPNTTEKLIPLLIEGKEVFDTPGFSRNFSILDKIEPKILREFNPEKRIKQYTFQVNSGNSIVFDSLFGISIASNQKVNVHFYCSKKSNIHRTRTDNIVQYTLKNIINHEYLNYFKQGNMKFINYKVKANEEFVVYVADTCWVVLKSVYDFEFKFESIFLDDIKSITHRKDSDFVWYNLFNTQMN